MAPRKTDINAISDAFYAVNEDGMKEARASRLFGVNRHTLRKRIHGVEDLDCCGSGRKPMFSADQEERLGSHFERMAGFGYGYTKRETIEIATQYASAVNLRPPNEKLLSFGWYRRFIKRWPQLDLRTSKPLDIYRAKAATTENLTKYFENLELCLDKYDLKDKPEYIFNVDEKAFVPTFRPPKVVASRKRKLLYSVTPPRGTTTTVIGGGNAAGVKIPPYFVFNKGITANHLQHATHGSAGTSSDNGWSNTAIFNKYMRDHFLPNLVRPNQEQPVLVIYDGHKSHVSLDLLDWAEDVNIKLFVLVAHTSHFMQPLDVGCFSPLENRFTSLKHERMRHHRNGRLDISDIVELGCTAYNDGLKEQNLQAAFRKTGIYPFKGIEAVDKTYIRQAELYLRATQEREDRPREDLTADELFFCDREGVFLQAKGQEPARPRNVLGNVVGGREITDPIVHDNIIEHMTRHGRQAVQRQPLPPLDVDTCCCVCREGVPPVYSEDKEEAGNDDVVSWKGCEACVHWVHDELCHPGTADDVFLCPCCLQANEN